ncbi:MAG TPA: glycosyltransferase [Acidimicrobiia bacterium]|nr:glycosyltransferase [Acidimicrobiia bacterium]
MTQNTQSRILLVIPTLGQRPDYLRQTLDSIKSQQGVIYDIVMIFPLDNEETMQLAHEVNAIIVDDPGGISAAVNAGIAQAQPRHEFIGWIGDDDLLATDSLKTAIEVLDQTSDAVLAFGFCDYIDDRGEKLFTNRAGNWAPWLMTWGPNLVPCPGTVFRKSALDKAGEFDVENKYCMDLDMLLRLRKLGKFVNTKRTMASFRWHSTSTTVVNRVKLLKEVKQVKRKHLSPVLRKFAPIWEPPVSIATTFAAKSVNRKAQKLKK